LIVDEAWPGDADAECTPLSYADGVLHLECTPMGEVEVYEFRVVSDEADVRSALASYVDLPVLELSFFRQFVFDFTLGTQFTLRTEGDNLLLFAYAWASEWSAPLEVDLNYEPFPEIDGVDAECSERPALHGAVAERPLAIEFTTDDGPVTLFDREMASVDIDGATFRILVAGAFEKLGSCPDFCRKKADITVFVEP
jgi:hypothetical protein